MPQDRESAPDRRQTPDAGRRMLDIRALSLAERLRLPAGAAARPPRAAALQRIEWWRGSAFGGDAGLFGAWLRAAGVGSQRDLLPLVEIAGATDAVADPAEAPDGAAAGPAEISAAQLASGQALAAAIGAPHLRWASLRLAAALDAAEAAGLEIENRAALHARLMTHIGERIHRLAVAPAALALNVARIRGQLAGETAEQRARDFAAQLRDPERRRAILSPYPVLERRLWLAVKASARFLEEMLSHIAADRAELGRVFGTAGGLRSLTLGRGDPHKGGRSVCFVAFETGRAVYKPKSLRIDRAFQDFLAWINEGAPLQLPLLTILDKGDHGWTGYVEAAEAESEADVARAYTRMGMLLAAMHVCRASDMHFENVIFAGAEPYAVDLETILTPEPARTAADVRRGAAPRAGAWSLLLIGYLPRQSAGVFDMSAAGAVAEQESPFEVPVIVGFEGDSPAAQKVRGRMAPRDNAPRLRGELQPAARHVRELEAGFRLAYGSILRRRAQLLSPDGPLRNFRDAEIRWVARSTMHYAKALMNANHPTALRDGLDQEFALARVLADRAHPAYMSAILRAEVEDLWASDIPYFSASSTGADLRDSRGRVLPGFFCVTGMQRMEEAVRAMSAADLERNAMALRAAFEVLEIRGAPERACVALEEAAPPDASAAFLDEAAEIGERLLAGAAAQDGEVSWISFNPAKDDTFTVGPAGPDLYGGSAGIGLFLAHLGAATGDARFTALARRCRAYARRTAGRLALGAFNGAAGALYFELRAGALDGDVDLRHARRCLRRLHDGVAHDRSFDIISGSAGALVVALRAMRRPELADEAAALALACGRHLHREAKRENGAATWPSFAFDYPMGGFSHGVTGIATALTELAATIGGDGDLDLAMEALGFEKTLFEPAAATWRDGRMAPDGDAHPYSWCHGAPGITLGLQRIRRLLGARTPDVIVRDIALGLAATLDHGGGGSHCLCHGVLGNIEPLLEDGDPGHLRRARAAAAAALEEKRAEGRWRAGIVGYHEVPGLMVGIAGVGLALLRLEDRAIPSVLTLDL